MIDLDFRYNNEGAFSLGWRRFKVSVVTENEITLPWEEYDGHGIISEWVTRAKTPGERVLSTSDGRWRLYYDWENTIKKARREGWGVWPEVTGLTNKQKTELAVKNDFERLRAFAVGDWYYVYIGVRMLDSDESVISEKFIGMIESDDYDGLKGYAEELAAELLEEDVLPCPWRLTPTFGEVENS